MMNVWLERRRAKEYKVFMVDDGEQWWYSAKTGREALLMYLEPFVGKVDSIAEVDDSILPVSLDDIYVEEMDPEKTLSVRMDDTNETVEKTFAEWAKEGPGPIASSVY